jgi:hypothetical protein
VHLDVSLVRDLAPILHLQERGVMGEVVVEVDPRGQPNLHAGGVYFHGVGLRGGGQVLGARPLQYGLHVLPASVFLHGGGVVGEGGISCKTRIGRSQ